MNLTLITGDYLLPKKISVLYALDKLNYQENIDFLLIEIDSNSKKLDFDHINPSYTQRQLQLLKLWEVALEQILNSNCNTNIIVTSCYSETDAGLEVSLPIAIIDKIVDFIHSKNGKLNIVCLADDIYAEMNKRSKNLLRNLHLRQLEWTFSQFLNDLSKNKIKSNVHFISLHHPLVNLMNILSDSRAKKVYLCYPINYFRRNPTSILKKEIELFKEKLSFSCLTIYDPMCIDEEVLISEILGERTDAYIKIRKEDRWIMLPNKIYFSEPELENEQEGFIKIQPKPSEEIKKIAKAQVSQRDFFWIKNCDLVLAWRPFIEKTHHAGVLSELQFAIHNNVNILAFSPIEDGKEHSSPFASMIKKYSDFNEFSEKLNKFINPIENQIKMESKPPKYCDHTSVGVVIYNEKNEVLLIERGTFPYGMAVPAGHVDEHGSFEEAAITEVMEEVGLTIKDLTLIAEGRRENPCRRENGTWHYWKVYEAKAETFELRLSEREAKKAEWCDTKRLIELGLQNENQKSLEKVWIQWFKDLKIIPS